MLHLTNGDSAAEALEGILGAGPTTTTGATGTTEPGWDVLPWRDVLHEGPVPGNVDDRELVRVRAGFLSGYGPSASEVEADLIERDERLERAIETAEEIVLWFEHDLYDQLQLVQILVRLSHQPSARSRTYLAQSDAFLATLSQEEWRHLAVARQPVTRAQIDDGLRAWTAFTGDDSSLLNPLMEQSSALPHLGAALRRLAEEYPWTDHGLSRTEAQALGVLDNGAKTASEAFRANQELEQAAFLGDSTFAKILARLSAPTSPLLTFVDGSRLKEAEILGDRSFWTKVLVLTDAGRRTLAGEDDHVARHGTDRWIGGVHLTGRKRIPRWDPARQRIVSP